MIVISLVRADHIDERRFLCLTQPFKFIADLLVFLLIAAFQI